MSKANADQEIMSLKKKNWILQEQLNRLEKDVQALGDLKERVIVVETFLRVRFPDFRAVDRSFSSFSRPTHSSLEPRSTLSGAGLSSSHIRDSPAPSRILGLQNADSLVSEDEEDDHGEDEDEDDDRHDTQNHSRRRSEAEVGNKSGGSLSTRPDERNLATVSQAKVAKWLNTHNIEANTEKPKSSAPKSTKRPRKSKLSDEQSPKKSKKPSPVGKCRFKVGGKPCKKQARRGCDICGEFVCADHRVVTINCPNYLDSIKDCFKDLEKHMDSPSIEDIYSHVDKPDNKEGMGRCVCCTGGKKRKVSRTRCQTCRRYICAEHQVRTIRCEAHRYHSLNQGLDSDYESSSVSSTRPDIIDHIDAI
ncbi:unnamed protein product [Allacma fusca]|uniref:Uncharacterized protein n=1 Tax=Allacma fusca TaxID=39272 RepID=A0A8J2PZG6_9HEXA|nr:unnamed protein product [Allacma fusca]